MASPHNATKYYSGMASCGHSGDDTACFRAAVTGIPALITCVACVVRLVTLIRADSDDEARVRSFKIIFSLAVVMSAMDAYKFIYWGKIAMHFVVLYLQVCQFLVLCLFYSKLALKAHGKAHLIKRVTWPITGAILAYFTIVLGIALFHHQDNTVECKDLTWMMFSASTVVLSIVFICAGVVLTRAMDSFTTSVPMSEANRFWRKKLSLWSLISSYLVASIVCFSFDVTFYAMADSHARTCSNVFGNSHSAGYNAFKITDRLVGLLPIWVMLAVLTYKEKVSQAADQDAVDVSIFTNQHSQGSFDSWGDEIGSINPQDAEDLGLKGFQPSVGEQSPLLPSSYTST